MFDKLLSVENKYDELMSKLGTVEVQADVAEYRRSAKTLSELEPLVQKFREYKSVEYPPLAVVVNLDPSMKLESAASTWLPIAVLPNEVWPATPVSSTSPSATML